MFDATAERRFLLLKKKLDSLHYCQPLTIESSALVERLLSDLIRTTEGFQSLKKANEDLKQEASQRTSGLLPLQKENSKILKENNELHYELIKVKETCEFQENKWKSSLKALEGEKTDLKFLLSQRQASLQRLESENQSLKQKLDVILSKAYTSKMKGLQNRDLELENLKNSINTNFLSSKRSQESREVEAWSERRLEDLKVWAEKLREADQKVLEMERELKSMGMERGLFEEKIRFLEQGTASREKEIKRLQSKLELSLPCDNLEKMAHSYESKQLVEKVQRLEHQIDFLTKENEGLGLENKTMKRDYARTELIKQELNSKSEECEKVKRVLSEAEQRFKEELAGLLKENERATNEAKILTDRLYSIEGQNQELMMKCEKIKEAWETEKAEKTVILEKMKVNNELASAYNSDKRVLADKLASLMGESRVLQGKIEEKGEEVVRLSKEIEESNKRLALSKGEGVGLRRENEQLRVELEEKTRSYEGLSEGFQRIQQELAAKNKEFCEVESALQEARTVLARLEARNKHIEAENNRVRSEFQRIQATKDSSDSAKQKLESLYESALREVEFLKGEAQFFEEKENSYLRDLFAEKEGSTALRSETLALKERVKSLELENQRMLQKAEGLLTTTKSLDARRVEQEKDLVNLRVLMENQVAFERKVQSLTEENEHLSGVIRGLKQEVDQKTLELIEVTAAGQQRERINAELRTSNDRLAEKSKVVMDENANLAQNLKKANERNLELESLKVLIDSFKEKLAVSSEENARLMHELASVQAKHEQAGNERSRLQGKNAELQQELDSLAAQVREFRSNELNTSSLGARMAEKTRGYELLIEDLKNSNKQLSQRSDVLLREVDELSIRLRNAESRGQELEEGNAHLTALINSLERSKEELFEKVRASQQEKSREGEEIERLKEEKRAVLSEKARFESEIRGLKNSILQIDQERDEMQALLDQRTEENAELKDRMRALESELFSLRRETQSEVNNREALNRAIAELEGQLREGKKRISGLSEENEELKRRLALRQQENNEMAEDLRLLSREHAKMNEEMTGLVSDREFLSQELKRISGSSAEQMQGLRALEIERDDLLGLYKESAGENEALKRNLEDVIEDNKEMFEKLKGFERESRLFEEERDVFQRKEISLQGEIKTLQRNLVSLTSKAEKTESLVQRLEFENRSLKAELSSFQDSLSGENMEKLAVKKELVQLESEKNQTLALNEKLELELSNRSGVVHGLQRELGDLEEVLERERKAKFEIECENQELREENAKLRIGTFRKEESSLRMSGRESWRRSLNEVAIGTEGLKEKARSLQKDYEEILKKEGN